MEETSTRLSGTVSSDLDATYTIPDDPRGMLLDDRLIAQSCAVIYFKV
jgi:hypothetical protein